MHATDNDRQQRALALGLPEDTAWEAIAEAEVAASEAGARERPDGIVSAHGQLATRSPEPLSDDDGEFHDVEETSLVSPH